MPPSSNKNAATFYVLATTLTLLIQHNHGTDYLCVGKKAGFKNGLVIKLKTLKMLVNSHTVQAEADVEAASNTGSLPDQLINPGEYEPLL